jgi:hypothetical protein
MKAARYIVERLEKKDDDDSRIADRLNTAVEGLSNPGYLYRALIVLGLSNVILWLCVVVFPADVRYAFEKVINLNGKLGIAFLGIPLGLGLFLTYSLFRLKFADIEEQNVESGPMGSFNYQSQAQKRYLVWLFSALGGVLNTLLLVLVDILLTDRP